MTTALCKHEIVTPFQQDDESWVRCRGCRAEMLEAGWGRLMRKRHPRVPIRDATVAILPAPPQINEWAIAGAHWRAIIASEQP